MRLCFGDAFPRSSPQSTERLLYKKFLLLYDFLKKINIGDNENQYYGNAPPAILYSGTTKYNLITVVFKKIKKQSAIIILHRYNYDNG